MPIWEQFRDLVHRQGTPPRGTRTHGKGPDKTKMMPNQCPAHPTSDMRSACAAKPAAMAPTAAWNPAEGMNRMEIDDVGVPSVPPPVPILSLSSSRMNPPMRHRIPTGDIVNSLGSLSEETVSSPGSDYTGETQGRVGHAFSPSSLPTGAHASDMKRARHHEMAERLVQQQSEQRQTHAGMPSYGSFTERYKLQEKMGDGAFSEVYKAKHRRTGHDVAVKVVRKYELNRHLDRLNPQVRDRKKATERANILKEVQIMRRLNHANIVRFHEFSESDDYYFLVLELAVGGELFHQITRLTYFSEALARHVIVQVAEAIKHMHDAGIVHRDIKPENILYEPIPFVPSKTPVERPFDEEKEDEGEFVHGVGGGGIGKVKIADFGLSKIVFEMSTKTPCGTAGYTAPEIVKDQRYNRSVDIWALGCVLYTMLSGFPPFYDEDVKVLTTKVARGEYVFLSPWWDVISSSAKDLISHLLTVDPRERYTIDQFLAHPWILEGAQRPVASSTLSPATTKPLKRGPTASPALDSPLLDAVRGDRAATRQARADLGLTTPGAHQLREAFDVSYAVHRMEEETRNNMANDKPDFKQILRSRLNDADAGSETGKLSPASAQVQEQRRRRGERGRASPSFQARQSPAVSVPCKPVAGTFELNMNNATLLRNRGGRTLHQHRQLASNGPVSPVPVVPSVPSPAV